MLSFLKTIWYYIQKYSWAFVLIVVSMSIFLIKKMLNKDYEDNFESFMKKGVSKVRESHDSIKIEKLKRQQTSDYKKQQLEDIKTIENPKKRNKELESFLNERL